MELWGNRFGGKNETDLSFRLSTKEKPALSPEFAHIVLQDFYFSFYHSQSDIELQTDILVFLALQYRDLVPKSQRGDLFSLRSKLQPAIAGLNIPLKHARFMGEGKNEVEISSREAQTGLGGFQSMWDTQLKALEKVLYGPHWLKMVDAKAYRKIELEHSLDLSSRGMLAEISSRIIGKDTRFQLNPRPNRSGEDAHESFFRTYAILQRPAQTKRFDALYSFVSRHAQSGKDPDLTVKIAKLKNLWETNHPGETFIPLQSQSAARSF